MRLELGKAVRLHWQHVGTQYERGGARNFTMSVEYGVVLISEDTPISYFKELFRYVEAVEVRVMEVTVSVQLNHAYKDLL